MCKCCGCGKHGMAQDQMTYKDYLGSFDALCDETALLICLIGLTFSACSLIHFASLLPLLGGSVGEYAISHPHLVGMYVLNNTNHFDVNGVENPPIMYKNENVSVEIGCVARGLHIASMVLCVVSLVLWGYMACFRKYSPQDNKFLTFSSLITNNLTQLLILVCALVWSLGLEDHIFQNAYPLILGFIAVCFITPCIMSWVLVLVPNYVTEHKPTVTKIVMA